MINDTYNIPTIEHQEAKIRQYADLYDYSIKGIYKDLEIRENILDEKPELQEILNDVIKKGNVLIVYSFANISKDFEDSAYIVSILKEKKASILSIVEGIGTTTAYGKLFFHMLGAMKAYENDCISDRISQSMKNRKDMGNFLGAPRYGYKKDDNTGKMIEIPEEQKIIERIKVMRVPFNRKKPVPYRKIADTLNKEGISCRKAKKWYTNTIKRIYENESFLKISNEEKINKLFPKQHRERRASF